MLPNTYHHFALVGTEWVALGVISSARCSLLSNQFRKFFMGARFIVGCRASDQTDC